LNHLSLTDKIVLGLDCNKISKSVSVDISDGAFSLKFIVKLEKSGIIYGGDDTNSQLIII
jgi:hypothetical protein